MRDEAKENVSTAAYRVALDPCIERRLAEIEEGFRRQDRGQPTGFRQPVTKPPSWSASAGTWEIAVSGQEFSHRLDRGCVKTRSRENSAQFPT